MYDLYTTQIFSRERELDQAEWSASETSSAVKDDSCFKTKENKLDIVTSI